MKTTLFLMLLFWGIQTLLAQDLLAQDLHQAPFTITFSQPQLIDSGQQSRFFYSWNHVSGPQAMNHRYKMNAFHTFYTFNNGFSFPRDSTLAFNYMPDSLSFMWNMPHLFGTNEPLDALAMIWYPWLSSSSSGSDFTGFRNDKTGASLPFLTRVDSLGSLDSTTSGGQTIYRWKLKKNPLVTTLVNVFSKHWLGNEFIYRDLI